MKCLLYYDSNKHVDYTKARDQNEKQNEKAKAFVRILAAISINVCDVTN